MNLTRIFDFFGSTSEVIGWLVLHSVWQFALLVGLLAVVDRSLLRQPSRTRYLVLLGGFLLLPLTPFLTLVWFPNPSDFLTADRSGPTPTGYRSAGEGSVFPWGQDRVASEFDNAAGDVMSMTGGPTPQAIEPRVSPEPLTLTSTTLALNSVVRQLQVWLPSVALFWLCGVLVFSLRLGLGFWTVRRLYSTALDPLPEPLQKIGEKLQHQLSIRQVVCFRQSRYIESPVVVGCFKSLILVPTGLVSNMPIQQLETILLHELLHVRRYDYAINLLQTWMETLFFYHPAVWWLSKRIRHERECCCDDGVIANLSNRVEYGKALLAIENLRNQRAILPVGSADGPLLHRVRRLFSSPSVDTPVGILLPVCGLILFLICVGQVAQQVTAQVATVSEIGQTANVGNEHQDQDSTVERVAPPSQDAEAKPPLTELMRVRRDVRPPRQMAAAYAASELPLWRDYLSAVEKIRNLSCAFEIHQKRDLEYAERTDDGYCVMHKFKSYKWDLETGHFIAEQSVFDQNYLPPHDWRNLTHYRSDQGAGFFLHEQFWGEKDIATWPWTPVVPHPMNFISSGSLFTADFVNSAAWNISESDNQLLLESQQPNVRARQFVRIDLDPSHGGMPRMIELATGVPPTQKLQFVVDRFERIDDIWLPVEMRVVFLSDQGQGMIANPQAERRVIVDVSQLRVNQEWTPAEFRFGFPDGASWSDADTGERVTGELGRQRLEEYRKNAKERNSSESNHSEDKLPDGRP